MKTGSKKVDIFKVKEYQKIFGDKKMNENSRNVLRCKTVFYSEDGRLTGQVSDFKNAIFDTTEQIS